MSPPRPLPDLCQTSARPLDDLSPAALRELIARLLAENAEQQRVIADQRAQIAELRAEIARLKGLQGRPRLTPSKPSGREAASSPKPNGKRRRGRSHQTRVAVEDQVITTAVPAGSRLKSLPLRRQGARRIISSRSWRSGRG
jgi:hypothetical protein